MAIVQTSAEEYLRNVAERKVIDYKNPNCNNCTDCCGMLSIISEQEFKKIKKQLKTPQWRSQYQGAKSRFIERNKKKDVVDLRCPFQHSGRCTIYTLRPTVCREFHCSPSLNKWDTDKFMEENPEHKTIMHLFK